MTNREHEISTDRLMEMVKNPDSSDFLAWVYCVGRKPILAPKSYEGDPEDALHMGMEKFFERVDYLREKILSDGIRSTPTAFIRMVLKNCIKTAIAADIPEERFGGLLCSALRFFGHGESSLRLSSPSPTNGFREDIYRVLLRSTQTFRFPEYSRFYARLVIYWVESQGTEPWPRTNENKYFHDNRRTPVEVRNAAFFHLRKALSGVKDAFL